MKHVYYICDHYQELVLYHGLCSFFRRFFPGVEQCLIFVEHPMFSQVNCDSILEGFDSVQRLPFCECAFTNRWRAELHPYAIYGRLARARAFLKEASKFSFCEDSLCFVSEESETALAVRLLVRKIRTDPRHPLLCRIGVCYHKSDECRTNDWISWMLHNFYVLAGAYPVSVNMFGWMVADRRYYREKKIMDYFLVYSNKWQRNKDFIEIKYPLLDDGQPATLQKQNVLFVDRGVGWLSLFPEMSRESYIGTTNQVLRVLTDLYKNQDVDLLFKPHPRQDEIPYDLAGFKAFDKNIIAEAFFLRNRKMIRAVYGVVSSTLRTASLFGINAYALGELYDLPEALQIRNQKSLIDFSDVVNIRSLDELQQHQPEPNKSRATTGEDLERLAKFFRELTSRRERTGWGHRFGREK
jgi:hypothetical protein